ncbi:hypothetical protein PHJA_001642800 [Phtheirospermum japonicum]|uniref:Uncharacterized protein n=1 Tax=Phtheirospermum japonicum TaxID=374723 RepID=A0A830CF67_9LAMI|nr:hypothetical protein PHJA_001642800 [Phtheirospermum japonicum]
MATIPYIVLVVICCSLHACNARRFGVAHKDPTKEFQFPTAKENDEKLNPSTVIIKPNVKYSIPDKFEENKVKKSEYNVAHKKKGKQGPEFNQDYMPPRTHPPVHN